MDTPAAPVDAAPGPATGCALEVSVATVTTAKDYRPRNVGALWIADSGGKFVKTIALWANRRITHLLIWNQVTSAAGLSRNTTDAVTGATASTHVVHKASWNCTDSRKMPMAQGMYQLCMEMTESSSRVGGTGTQKSCVPFMHAGTAFQSSPPDEAYFKARQLSYAPR